MPRVYVRTAIDKVTTPALQDRMISNRKVESVPEESGHFPAFSVPEDLAELMFQAVPDLCEVVDANAGAGLRFDLTR